MSYVVALPEMMSAAATDVASVGSVVATANQGVAAATTRVLPAAEDEVSAAIAALFSAHGRGYQAVSAQAAAFHAEFVQALTGAAGAYAAAEAANASPLGSIEKALLGAEHEIQQIPTTLATGFGNELNFLLTAPSSPLLAQFTGNNPLFGLFLSNTPPKLLPLLLGETIQHTTYDGMSVVQITPAHRRDLRGADLPVAAARRYRRSSREPDGWSHLLANHRTWGLARQRDGRLRGRQPRAGGRRRNCAVARNVWPRTTVHGVAVPVAGPTVDRGCDRQRVGRRSFSDRPAGESGVWVTQRTSAHVCLYGHGGFTRTIGDCPRASGHRPGGPDELRNC